MRPMAMIVFAFAVLLQGSTLRQEDGAVASAAPVAFSDVAVKGPASDLPESAVDTRLTVTSRASAAPPPLQPPPPRAQQKKAVIPAGTTVRVVTIDTIDANPDKINSTFLAALYAPITVGDMVVVPERAKAYLKLTDAASASKLKGKSEIQLALDSIEFQGDLYVVKSSTYSVEGKSQGKETAKKAGIGAVAGTAIGAIAGGGKGAAIGAVTGGGGGLAIQAIKKGDRLEIPPETRLEFTLQKPVELTIRP